MGALLELVRQERKNLYGGNRQNLALELFDLSYKFEATRNLFDCRHPQRAAVCIIGYSSSSTPQSQNAGVHTMQIHLQYRNASRLILQPTRTQGLTPGRDRISESITLFVQDKTVLVEEAISGQACFLLPCGNSRTSRMFTVPPGELSPPGIVNAST